MAPSTKTVVTVGEEALAKSITRMGELDFFSVVSRKPRICDFKPVQIEVAIARLASKAESDEQVQVLRFANRVPLQFDKSACAIVRAIESVNWRSYGIAQPKKSLPVGPYIVAVSVVSPFIKFKNASKETIDASDELVDELRKALIQAGQKLSRFIKREKKEAALEEKIKHIEQFGPILVGGLVRILNTSEKRKTAAEKGLEKILGRDTMTAKDELKSAAKLLDEFQEKNLHIMQAASQTMMDAEELADEGESEQPEKAKSKKSANPKAKKATQKKSVAKTKTEPVKTKKTAVPKVKKAKVSKRKSKSKGRKR